MKLDKIIEEFSKKHNGAFVKVTWKSDLTKQMTDEAKRKGFIVTKEITSVVRKGVRGVYEEQRGLQTLKIPPLQWGNYYRNSRTIIEHRGKYYVKLFTTYHQPKIQYYVNGVPLDRDEFEKYPLLKPSYWFNKDTKNMKDFMIIKIDNIEKIW